MVKVNSSIDFIQSSGGNIDHVHHAKLSPLGDGFKPQGSSPLLPSGSIWLRPNDGQAERLEYQGEDSLFQIRPTEGYAYYTTTTTHPENLTLLFETTVVEDSRFITKFNTASSQFTVHVSGLYRISVSVRLNNSDSTTLGWSLSVNLNSQASITRISEEVPNASNGGGGHGVLTVIAPIQRGRKITISNVGFAAVAEEAGILIEFIRPLDLGNDSNIV